MNESFSYRSILKKYPRTLSKEQFCKLCHISKRVAKYYLDNGIVPCKNNGQATHKYEILTTDVIDFLRERKKNANKYHVTVRSKSGYKPVAHSSISYTPQVMQAYQHLLQMKCKVYPDLMTAKQVSELTGYSLNTVLTWVSSGHLRWFKDGPHCYMPKTLVIKFLLSEDFRNIRNKSKTHNEIIRQLSDISGKEENSHD